MHEIGQSRELLGRLLEPLSKTGLPLMGNVLKPLARSVLIPLGLTAAALATDAVIHKKMFGSITTTLIVSNEEMNYFMKNVKSLKESGLLIKDVSDTIKHKAKGQKGKFLSILLDTLCPSLSRNLLTDKGLKGSKIPGLGVMKVGEEPIRASQVF